MFRSNGKEEIMGIITIKRDRCSKSGKKVFDLLFREEKNERKEKDRVKKETMGSSDGRECSDANMVRKTDVRTKR